MIHAHLHCGSSGAEARCAVIFLTGSLFAPRQSAHATLNASCATRGWLCRAVTAEIQHRFGCPLPLHHSYHRPFPKLSEIMRLPQTDRLQMQISENTFGAPGPRQIILAYLANYPMNSSSICTLCNLLPEVEVQETRSMDSQDPGTLAPCQGEGLRQGYAGSRWSKLSDSLCLGIH